MSEVAVDVLLDATPDPLTVGRLFLRRMRGVESASFHYADGWLAHPGAYAIDPALPLVGGTQHTAPGQQMFRALADSAPDRWGVELARRFERRRGAAAGGHPRQLGEGDFLLAVRDDLRQGALRLRDPGTGSYLAAAGTGIPHLVDLPRLLSASDHLDADADTDDDLRLLLDAGSSLGGARPKAHVTDGERLMIAKFPRASDPWSVVTWEAITRDMAEAAGIRAAQGRLLHAAGRGVLLVDRFDRSPDGGRVGYCSALTMLEAADGVRRPYSDIAAAIEAYSPRATDDLRELWRRIAFSILVSNSDDHLRNHGFVREVPGWSLAPAFDINPSPDTAGAMTTAIHDPSDPRADIGLLVARAPWFRVDDPAADLRPILDATAVWSERAARAGVGREVDRLRPAFEHPQREQAEQIARG